MRFKVIDQEGNEIPDCIIVKTKHDGFDVYYNERDFSEGVDTIEKDGKHCKIVLEFD